MAIVGTSIVWARRHPSSFRVLMEARYPVLSGILDQESPSPTSVSLDGLRLQTEPLKRDGFKEIHHTPRLRLDASRHGWSAAAQTAVGAVVPALQVGLVGAASVSSACLSRDSPTPAPRRRAHRLGAHFSRWP